MAMYGRRVSEGRSGRDSASPVDGADGEKASVTSITGDAESFPLCEEEYLQQLSVYRELREGRLQKWLDSGLGACVLGVAANRKIVESAIMHFNGSRYVIYAFVVMPNHVHVLFMPLGDNCIPDILASWKRFSSRQLNNAIGSDGPFWQKESWDHLVRNERQFAKYLSYIKANDGDKAYDAYEAMECHGYAENCS